MNHYGLLAQDHWRTHAPKKYAELGENPEEFFAELGETLAVQVLALTLQLEETIPDGLDYMHKVAAMRAVQKQAEEVILTEEVWSVREPSTNLEEQLSELLGELPNDDQIEDGLNQIQDEAEQTMEAEGWPELVLDDDQVSRRSRLLRLRELIVIPEGMTEDETRERIEALRELV